MQAVLFSAGLGDSIRAFYRTDRYTRLSETNEMLAVILATHNPCVHECFLHHPNRINFKIIHIPGQYDRLFAEGLRRKELNDALCLVAGFDPADIVGAAKENVPEFYATDDVQGQEMIVIQPFAGANNRSIPLVTLRRIVSECLQTGREVHIVTRSYARWVGGRRMHDDEILPDDLVSNPAVVWHRNLSVPATLNLVKKCAFFVGCHSSLLQAAWLERKPTFVLYPKNHSEWQPDKLGSGYTFGVALPSSQHQAIEGFDPARLRAHLKECGIHLAGSGGLLLRGSSAGTDMEAAEGGAGHSGAIRKALPHSKYRGRLGKTEIKVILYPGGNAYLERVSEIRRWEIRQNELRLLGTDNACAAELREGENGLSGKLHGQELAIVPDLNRRRYLVCGLQRTCTNLFEHYFNTHLSAPRVTQFHGGQGYWKHGWLPVADQLRDLFVIVCVRHPLHWLSACYDYFLKEHGKDRSICPRYNPEWTFEEWLQKPHYQWPSPVERWNVMNEHWLRRVDELGVNAVIVRAEDCQTEWLQRSTFKRVLAQYDPLLPVQLTEGYVPNRLTNTNNQTVKGMDPTPYLHRTYLERYTPEMKDKVLQILDGRLLRKLGYD